MLVSAEYHPASELARQKNVTQQAVTGWCRSKKILAVRFGRYWWIPSQEFERLTGGAPE